MKERLENEGVEVTGWVVPAATCMFSAVKEDLYVANKEAAEEEAFRELYKPNRERS